MVATTFLELKGKNDPLVVSALDYLVLLHKWAPGAAYMPADLTDSSGVLQSVGAGWFTSGEIQKKKGVDLTPDTQSSPVEGYGSSGPRRTILTAEGFTVDYLAQEWRKGNLEMWNNVDLSTTSATPGKGFHARKTSQLSMTYYSAIVIAYDGMPSAELYPWWMFGKVGVTKRAAMSGQQGAELGLPMTLTIFEDTEWGALYDFGVAGSGFDAIATDAGFLSAATSITVSPATTTLAVGGQLQLLVLDNHGFDRTSEATYVSGTPAKATVTSGGRITAVASGTSTVTVTLGALTPVTCAVTVS